ncbi:MAG: hypothetical protein ABW122_04265 [Ilumatobacteraceae bacterium]
MERGTEYGASRDGVRVEKLAGPGVSGRESDPPLYHIDLTSERLAELQADPVPFLRSLGLPADEVAPDDVITVRFTRPRWGWNGRTWERAEAAADLAAVLPPDGGVDGGAPVGHSCCYSSGPDEMTCHWHYQDPHTDTVFVDD